MKLERRTEGASDHDQDRHQDTQPHDSVSPEPVRLDAPDDPLRGMSDGEVLQRLELM